MFSLDRVELELLLVNDRQMKALNGRYRGFEKTTDVLSFPMYMSIGEVPEGNESLLGTVVISLHTAQKQSSLHNLTLYQEVRRLLIHGFLHLLGYDHELSPYQNRKMRKKEQELSDALETLDQER